MLRGAINLADWEASVRIHLLFHDRQLFLHGPSNEQLRRTVAAGGAAGMRLYRDCREKAYWIVMHRLGVLKDTEGN